MPDTNTSPVLPWSTPAQEPVAALPVSAPVLKQSFPSTIEAEKAAKRRYALELQAPLCAAFFVAGVLAGAVLWAKFGGH